MTLSDFIEYISYVERRASSLLESARTARREYIQLISVFGSAMRGFKRLLNLASCIETSAGAGMRLCGRWMKYHHGSMIVLAA